MNAPQVAVTEMVASARSARWPGLVLLGAGLTDIALGLALTIGPALFLAGAPTALDAMLLRSAGATLVLVGIGLLFARFDAARFWPLVVVGLIGNVPGGIALSLLGDGFKGELVRVYWPLGLRALWIVPLVMVLSRLWKAARAEGFELGTLAPDILEAYFEMATTQRGETIAEISSRQPVMLVLMRHAGCTFCREALSDLRAGRREIERQGVRIVLVHVSPESETEQICHHYEVDDLDRIADPEAEIYRVLGVGRGSMDALFGPRVWLRGIAAGVFGGHGLGQLAGDFLRMPGVFMIRNSRVVGAFRHRSAADRPDYVRLAAAPALHRA